MIQFCFDKRQLRQNLCQAFDTEVFLGKTALLHHGQHLRQFIIAAFAIGFFQQLQNLLFVRFTDNNILFLAGGCGGCAGSILDEDGFVIGILHKRQLRQDLRQALDTEALFGKAAFLHHCQHLRQIVFLAVFIYSIQQIEDFLLFFFTQYDSSRFFRFLFKRFSEHGNCFQTGNCFRRMILGPLQTIGRSGILFGNIFSFILVINFRVFEIFLQSRQRFCRFLHTALVQFLQPSFRFFKILRYAASKDLHHCRIENGMAVTHGRIDLIRFRILPVLIVFCRILK